MYIFLFTGQFYGGGKRGSIHIRITFSIREGIILSRSGQGVSRQGLVLTSISQGFNY